MTSISHDFVARLLGDLARTVDCQPRICFLPNSRASIENAPGPIIAKVPPMVARKIAIPTLPEHVKAIHISRATISVPVNGVHRPVIMQIANNALRICVNIAVVAGVSQKRTTPSWSRARPTTNRWINSPRPGQPSANVVKSRCKNASLRSLRQLDRHENL